MNTEMRFKGEKSKLAGKTVKVIAGEFAGQEYRVEDWQPLVFGKSWMVCDGNPACLDYAIRGAMENTPTDNNVLYGKIGDLGKIIHVSQIDPAAFEDAA